MHLSFDSITGSPSRLYCLETAGSFSFFQRLNQRACSHQLQQLLLHARAMLARLQDFCSEGLTKPGKLWHLELADIDIVCCFSMPDMKIHKRFAGRWG
jgi:hypothetical protein